MLIKKSFNLKNFYKFLIIITFSIFFLPHVFIMNEDFNLLMAFEVDSGSLATSINQLFNKPYYNMFNGYHTTYYGWTYAAINFIFLVPLKLISIVFKLDVTSVLILNIKIVFFFINLFSVLILLRLCNKIIETKYHFLGFILTIIYVFSPFREIFTFLHPETTGILFTFLGIVYLLDYNKKFKTKFLYYSFSCFVLAVLSKQSFAFSSIFFIFFTILIFLKDKINFKEKSLLFKPIISILIKFFLIFLFIFFLIHPYAFFYVMKFYGSQFELSKSFSTINNTDKDIMTFIKLWISLYKNELFYVIPFYCSIINLFILLISKKKNLFKIYLNFLLILCVITTIIFFAKVNHVNISLRYYQILIPLIFLQMLLFLDTILTKNLINNKYQISLISAFLIIYIVPEIRKTHDVLTVRLSYKDTPTYKTYQFINNNLNINDRIANDHFIAIPEKLNNIQCHYWRECNSYEAIVKFNPNYVAHIDPLPVWGWSPNNEGKNLLKYINQNNMGLLKTFEFINSDHKILIYKK
jgi:hypothetical protein